MSTESQLREWTRDWVLRNISGLLPDEAVDKLCNAHNAALAAADKRFTEAWNKGVMWERERQLKPLVERLQESNGVLKVLLNFSDDVKRVHAKTLCEVIDKNTDALAKVKEG